MSLQLFLGSAGSGKSYQLYREIISESKKNPDINYLVIVPEQFTLQTQKDMVTMDPNHGIMNIDVLSFLRFAYRIFDEVGGNDYPILEDTGKSMVVRRVIAEKKNDLILFGAGVRKTGFVNELKSLLSEFFQYNVGEEDFERMFAAAERKPVLKAKLKDIHKIHQGFTEFMANRYITAEEIMVLLSQVMEKSQWLRNSVICFDGFTGFTPSQNDILGKMMRLAKKVMVTVTIDPREEFDLKNDEHQLFSLSKKTILKLLKIAKETNTELENPIYGESFQVKNIPYRFAHSKALAALEKNLFRYPYKVYEEAQDEICIRVGKDAEQELSYVVHEIKRLVREEGYRFKDIAVITGDVEQYGRIAKRLFGKAGIPCFIDHKKEILSNPFAMFLRSAIGIVADDFSYESVFRYLRTGLSRISQEEIDLFENYVLATGIRGHKRYSEPLKRAYKSKEPLNLTAINEIREKFLGEIEPLYLVLKDKDCTVSDYTRALYQLGIELDIEHQLKELSNRFQELGMASVAKEYDQIYGIVMELYDQMVLLLGSEIIAIKEYADILETGLSETKVGLIPPGVDEIVVGDMERTRLKDIKAMFLVGANEGILPKSIVGGGILSDLERELLVDHNIELAPTKRQRAFTEQFYIYLNVTKPSERLYVSFHKINGEGKSANPSYLISKLKGLFSQLSIVDLDSTEEEMESVLQDDGINYLAQGLREFDQERLSNLWRELYLYYQQDNNRQLILEKLREGAFYINQEKGITKEVARLLYGTELAGSVTRIEKYAGCPFSHFMAYGLSLEERQEYKLAVPDIGNIFHNAIDEFSKMLDRSEYTWHTIPDETREEWAMACVNKAVEEYENLFIKSTKRNEYLIKRIERITIRTLWALCHQIQQGAFEPMGYEMPFVHQPENFLTLKGRIDRLDLVETEDAVYVRVVDYKSGSTKFDYQSIYYGLQQQLAVYLSATMDYLGNKHPSKKVVPSGIFYYHIDDPIVAKSEQVEEDIYASLRMNGLVNQDKKVVAMMDEKLAGPDGTLRPSTKSDIIPVKTNKEGEFDKKSSVAQEKELKALLSYVNGKLVTDGKQILEGDTRVNPYSLGKKTACDYCPYKSVCGFDLRLPGHGYNNLAKKSVDDIKEEIWGES